MITINICEKCGKNYELGHICNKNDQELYASIGKLHHHHTPQSSPPSSASTVSSPTPTLPALTLQDSAVVTYLRVELPATDHAKDVLENLKTALCQVVENSGLPHSPAPVLRFHAEDQTVALQCSFDWSSTPCAVGQRESFVAALVLLSALHLRGDHSSALLLLSATSLVSLFLGPRLRS